MCTPIVDMFPQLRSICQRLALCHLQHKCLEQDTKKQNMDPFWTPSRTRVTSRQSQKSKSHRNSLICKGLGRDRRGRSHGPHIGTLISQGLTKYSHEGSHSMRKWSGWFSSLGSHRAGLPHKVQTDKGQLSHSGGTIVLEEFTLLPAGVWSDPARAVASMWGSVYKPVRLRRHSRYCPLLCWWKNKQVLSWIQSTAAADAANWLCAVWSPSGHFMEKDKFA